MTTAGEVDLSVGRSCVGGSATAPLGRYARRRPEIDAAIKQSYVAGVSTWDMAAVTEALVDKRVGRSTVSRVTRRLEDEVEALRRAPIVGPMAYLYLDATFVDARWARTVENVSALVAYGIGTDNHRHLLGVHIGASEPEASWAELLASWLRVASPACASSCATSTLGSSRQPGRSCPRSDSNAAPCT